MSTLNVRTSDEPNRNEQLRDFFEALAEHDNLASVVFDVEPAQGRVAKVVCLIAGQKDVADNLAKILVALVQGADKLAEAALNEGDRLP